MIQLLLVALLSIVPMSQDVGGISICRVDWDWPRYIVSPITPDTSAYYLADGAFWDEANQTLLLEGYQFEPPNGLVQIGEVLVQIFDGVDFVDLKGTLETPLCSNSASETEKVSSVKLEASGECVFVEIEDAYGNWHLVTDGTNPQGICWPVVNGTVQLIVVDPDAHYRIQTWISE